MLRTSAVVSGTALLAFALAGCGGGGGGGRASVLPLAPSQATAPPTKSTVKFTIVVPKESASTLAHRPAYVSPATASMTVAVTGTGKTTNPTGFPITVGLTPTSPDCTSSLASTTCTLPVSLAAGSYAAAISTFDGANGTGNELSAAQAVAFTVVANTNNTIPLTLSGIPAQINPTYLGGGKFTVVALDADGNYIVGAGAPTFTVAKSAGSTVVAITQPTTGAPNAFSIATASEGTETLTITAGYPAGATSGCVQPGAVCTSSFSASATQNLFALAYYGVTDAGGAVAGFTVPFTSTSSAPAFTYYDFYPYGGNIALDPNNGNLFFSSDYYDSSEPFYEVAAPYTGSETSLGSAYVSGLAVDTNHNLFVSNYGGDTVSEYASPYTGAATKTFSTDYPFGVALDANNNLFVGNYDYDYVTEYPYSNGSYGGPVYIPTNDYPLYVAIDASGNLWAYSYDNDTIQEFKPPFSASSSAVVTITGTDANLYCETQMFFDPSGDLFVMNDGEYIDEYTASQISAGGTIPSSSAHAAIYAGDGYGCLIGTDSSGNLYSSAYYYSSQFANDGGVLEFSPPFSSASLPAYSVPLYYPYYNGGVIAKPVSLSVTL